MLRFIGLDIAHDHALANLRGETMFRDDIPAAEDILHVHVTGSPVAAGKLVGLNLKKVREYRGVVTVVCAGDIPGVNNIGPLANDEPVFADKMISYRGQPLFAVAAQTIEIARSAAELAIIEYEACDPVITISDAQHNNARLSDDLVIKRGRSAPAIKNSEHMLSGHFTIGGQDHFYLENQTALAVPGAVGQLLVYSSTQNIFSLQKSIISAIKHNDVVVKSMRIGGAFGGKQTQSVQWAIISALVTCKTQRPAAIRLDRNSDMVMTGKRHDFTVDYRVGFDDTGTIKGVEITLASRCGCSADLSEFVNDNAALHVDNAYYLKNITVISKRYKTNTVSNTVFRGSGRPQGILAIERILDDVAARLQIDPLKVRIKNLYGKTTGMNSHYGMRVADETMLAIINDLKRTSTYLKRRRAIAEFNQSSPVIKRGIALTPVKFGVSTGKIGEPVQTGARVKIEKNGAIEVHLCAAELGQGLYIKVVQIVAEVFQVDPSTVNICAPRTDLFAEMAVVTGSLSVDLNGRAAQNAAEKLKQRLMGFATELYGQPENKIKFTPEGIKIGRKTVQFKTLAARAAAKNLKLSAFGTFAGNKTSFNRKMARGHPYNYFVYGAAVAEAAIDSLTGECKVLRVDILQDCGQSINSAIDTGQIEGGFLQGMGWMIMEELLWDSQGELLTQGPCTYKIPVSSDLPGQFNVRIWNRGKADGQAIFSSKSVGELPLVLAVSVYSAVLQAVASVKSDSKRLPEMNIPATPERILMAINSYRS